MPNLTSKHIITVFGGTGFIGTELIKALALTTARIRVATRYPQSVERLKPLGVVGQISPIIVNIHDDTSIDEAVNGSDYVVNLTGILAESNNCSFDLVHHRFPEEIARACWRYKIKHMVHISALGANLLSLSNYAKSKALGEKAVQKKAPSCSILRPSIVFGPRDNFFNKFATMATFSPCLPLIGGGHTKFQPVYVNDIVRAIMHCLQNPKKTQEIYECGGPEIYSFKSLLEKTLTMIGKNRKLITLPWKFASFMGGFSKFIPNAPITQDQVELLKSDNIVSNNMPGLNDLGIKATHLDLILPTYLSRYQSGSMFKNKSI